MAMVPAHRHLRQRKAFACDDSEWSLDFAWRSIPGRFAVAPLAGGKAKSESRTFRADWLQRFLEARRRTRAFRSTAGGGLCYHLGLSRGFCSHARRILEARVATLFRVVSWPERPRRIALRFQHWRMSRRFASGSREPEPGSRIKSRVLLIPRGDDAGGNRARLKNPESQSWMKLHPTGILLWPDNKRVVVRPFIPIDPTRVEHVIARALTLSEPETDKQLSLVRADFSERHIDLDKSWLRHFEKVRAQIPDGETISEPRRLFIGALFSGEYALESAALFNPSIVPHPDQTGLGQGDLRFILSLRSTGEGHISSIQFRTGVIHRDHSIDIKKTTPFVTLPELNPNPTYHKRTFLDKLNEMGLENAWAASVMGRLGKTFLFDELDK